MVASDEIQVGMCDQLGGRQDDSIVLVNCTLRSVRLGGDEKVDRNPLSLHVNVGTSVKKCPTVLVYVCESVYI